MAKRTAVDAVLEEICYELGDCQLPPICVIERYKAKYPKFARAIQEHFDAVEEMICEWG